MRISILQGEREMARDNWKLGELDIPFAPAPKGQARVGVQFEIDANGILQVLARDTATGTDRRLAISSAVDVADEAVEQMLGDSLEHAFSDVEERVFTETRMKALEMLPALEIVLAGLGGDLEESTRVRLDELVTGIHRAIAARATEELKTLIRDLDLLTEPLAAEFLEKSLDLCDPT
jgi:molecular chaperone DnaK